MPIDDLLGVSIVLKTSRGEMHDDPLIFSLKDQASWIVFINMMMVILVSI